MKTIELKSCPFCGGRAIHESWETDKQMMYGTGYIGCRNCRCFMDYIRGEYGKTLAVEAWNRRADDEND